MAAALRCKVGDLAVIVNGEEAPENVGAIVEVVEAVAPCTCGCIQGPLWRVQSRGRKLVGWNLFNMKLTGNRLVIPDAHLRPIRGEDIADAEVRELYAPGDVPCPALVGQGGEVAHG